MKALVLLVILLVALLASGCSSMAWPVNDATTVEQLNDRHDKEAAAQWQCADYDWQAECPEYHRVWRRYWQARRELAELKGWQ